MRDERAKVVEILDTISDAMHELNGVWLELTGDEAIELDRILTDKYPFPESFDEVTYMVSNWKENVKEQIREQEKKPLGYKEDSQKENNS